MRAPSCTIGKTTRRISIGDWFVSDQPVVLETLLGSCVSACLFDPAARVGGMNHIFLPGDPDLARYDKSTRYGINAMEILINRIMDKGGQRARLRAKIFGGARILGSTGTAESSTGPKNVQFVQTFLEKERIPVLARDVGGSHTRVLYFHVDTGDVMLRRLAPLQTAAVVAAEKRLKEKVRRELDRDPDVTLFYR